MELSDKDRNRFWSKVEVAGPQDCWEWQASVTWNGYGQFHVGQKSHKAHRVSFFLIHGIEAPDFLCLCHKCDNPGCVNPAHLWLGTVKDNNNDKAKKGRGNQPRGEKHSKAILTDSAVVNIRQRYQGGGVTQIQLAREYGVHKTTIQRLVSGSNWSWLK